MKRIILTLCLVLALVACQQAPTNDKKEEAAQENTKMGQEGTSPKIGIIQFIDQISLDAVREGFEKEIKSKYPGAEIIVQNAQGEAGNIPQITQKMVQEKVDVILAIATPAAQGALTTKGDIPLVFAAVTDPKGAGLEGKCTGVTDEVDPGQQIDQYIKLFPNIKTIGTLYNTGEQNSRVQVERLEKACASKNLKLEAMGINNINDIPQAMTILSKKIDGYFALSDNYVASGVPLLVKSLNESQLPSFSSEEGQAKKGLLMASGVDYLESGKQAAGLVDKLLQGSKIEDLPIEKPASMHTVFNEKTASMLKLSKDQYPQGDNVVIINE